MVGPIVKNDVPASSSAMSCLVISLFLSWIDDGDQVGSGVFVTLSLFLGKALDMGHPPQKGDA